MPSGLEIYLLPLAMIIPSDIVFLCMVQLFQKRVQSREQHNAMHWAELLQVRTTIASYGPSLCVICLNLHRVTFLTPAEYVTHCSARLFTKRNCYLLNHFSLVFHIFIPNQVQHFAVKRQQLFVISFRLCLPCSKNLLKISFVLHNPHAPFLLRIICTFN